MRMQVQGLGSLRVERPRLSAEEGVHAVTQAAVAFHL